jgi:hypothetical protein
VSLEALVYNLIDRYMNGGHGTIGNVRYHERHALVTSYDPERYLAKVMLWPEGQESGWLPIETAHIGNDFGIAVGLTPGDGKKSGDQVIVRMQEGDLESGKIVQRVHSDDEKPPTVQAGELVMWSRFKKSGQGKSSIGDDSTDPAGQGDQVGEQGAQGGTGQQFYFKNDGSTTWTDGNGATIVFDGKGNITITCNNLTVNASNSIVINATRNLNMNTGGYLIGIAGGDLGMKGGGNAEFKGGGLTGVDGGSEVVIQGGGDVTTTGVIPPMPQPSQPPFQVP